MQAAPGIEITEAPSLAERTSIRVGGTAVAEVRVTDARGFDALPGLVATLGGRPAAFGRGSNILAADDQLPLVLLSLAEADGVRAVAEEGDTVLLRAPGGMALPVLLAKAAASGLSGLEGLAGIPGSVGGAVAMNAGSFGVCMGEAVRGLEIFSPSSGLMEKKAADLRFGYRSFSIQGHEGWFLVRAVTLALRRDSADAVRARMRRCRGTKLRTQPVNALSAGCVFKNPAPDAPAGKLLDEAGLKGRRVGGMAFSSLHANFLVNLGNGRFAEAEELLHLAGESVRERFGRELELEVELWR